MPPTRRAFDTATMTRFLSYVLDPTIGCCEVRIFGAERKKGNIVRSEYHTTVAGWFDDIEALIAEVTTCQKVSVYLTLNPVTSDLMYRDGSNHLARTRTGSSDDDIVVIRWLYIDIDPVRPAGISSTDTELALAITRLNRVLDEVPGLRECAIWGCSGNGGWILVALPDLPNLPETRDLVARGLQALSAQFSDKAVKVDPSVKNPSRVMCLPGTLKCKGTHGTERPWRPVTLDTPDDGPLCRFDLAGYLATQAPVTVALTPAETAVNAAQNGTDGGLLGLRIATYLAKYHPAVEGDKGSNQCFDAACAIVQGFGLEPDQAFPYLAQWNLGNVPPFSDAEMAHKCADATRVANGGKPRGYLLERNQQDIDGAAQVSAGEHPDCPAGMEDNPHRLARVIYYSLFDHCDGPTLWYWSGAFYYWSGSCYRQLEAHEIKVAITKSLEVEFQRIYQQRLISWGSQKPGQGRPEKAPAAHKVTTRIVADVTNALAGMAYLSSELCSAQPAWLDHSSDWDAADVLPARNMLVHLPSYVNGSGYSRPPTPAFFSTSALTYEFDPAAPSPVNWLTFLGAIPLSNVSPVKLQVWPDDMESIEALQEWFGLHLVSEAKHQKMLALIGPTRSGKGTITSILSAMIGVSNVEGPTLASLEDRFGMEPLIGKRAAIIDDARISSKTDTAVIAERLLSISGQGLLTVPRKHISSWKGKLNTKVTILSNELPRLIDSSGAFAGRFLVLSMTRSFADQEDPDLEAKLMPELPGILLWALDGWNRLSARQRFVQPKSGKELVSELKNLSSPIRSFLEDCCEVGDEKEVKTDVLFASWLDWCKLNNKKEGGESSTFGRNLRAVIPQLRTTESHESGARVRYYKGVEIRSGYYDDNGNLVPF